MVNFMNIDNNNENNGTTGNKGKFSERLKKIQRDKRKKTNNVANNTAENIIVHGGRNILKVFLALPSMVYTATKVNNDSKTVDSIDNEYLIDENTDKRKLKVNKIKNMDVSFLRKQKEVFLREMKKYTINKGVEQYKVKNNNHYSSDTEVRIVKLQKEIIDLIKKNLVKNINELEVLQSELFLLRELNGEDIYLKNCQEDIKEIKKMLSKIKSLKEKYDYLKDNVDFEYMLEYNDDLLIDKILELKELCSSDDIRYVVDNYRLLNEYKFLYLKIDKLQEDTVKYEEYRNLKAEELKQRDINFDKMKNDIYDIDKENVRYDNFVREQELFLKELEGKISKIDSYEKVSYRLNGFNQLLSNSFKYLGLLLINPLKGLMPGIVTQTLVTKNVISNLYNNLEWEENKKIIYEAIDYSTALNAAMSNLDMTSMIIDSTLEDISKLKNKYMKDFSKYEYSFSSYRDAIKKINKMENAVLGSKIKIEKMQQRMKEKERQNENKLKMVKKLNSG